MTLTLDDIIISKYDELLFDVLDHKHTHYTLFGGRGSTKSSFISIAIILLVTQNPDCHAVAFRKVANTMRDSIYSQLSFAISKLGLDGDFKRTVSPMEITYIPTGQKILFRGLDEPEKIKSIKASFGYFGITWMEELDQFHGRDEIRTVLQSTMRGGSKYWHFESFNPPKSRDNWANVDLWEEYSSRKVVKSSYLDVPVEWLSEQFIIEAERLRDAKPQAYEHELLGIATGTGGAIFENVIERTITDEEIEVFDRIKQGVDFGFATDPFVWIKMHYDKTRRTLYIFDEIFEIKLSNTAAFEKIKARHAIHTNPLITADSAEPKSIAQMQQLGLNITGAKKGPDSVEFGIKFLQDLDSIVIDKTRCPNAYREFSLYEYDVDKYGNYISAFPDKNNHCIDGCRYALESEMRNQKIIVF